MADPSVQRPDPDADGLVGGIVIWPSDVLPSAKWMFCQGQLLKRADYGLLFSRLGTRHNTGGEAGTDFRLPNGAGRVPVCQDTAQTEFDTIGETGGSKSAPTSAHSHPLTGAPQVTGAPGGTFVTGLTTTSINNPASGTPTTVVTGASGTGSPTIGTLGGGIGSLAVGNSTGAGDNLQPYLVTQQIIKIL